MRPGNDERYYSDHRLVCGAVGCNPGLYLGRDAGYPAFGGQGRLLQWVTIQNTQYFSFSAIKLLNLKKLRYTN